MAMGRREAERQGEFWVATAELPRSAGHPFYQKLNQLLDEAGFDAFVEQLCRPHYAAALGRPSIPPGVYFRMLFIGYFEGLDSQRGIAWRCADSLALKLFLGYALTQPPPEHSSLTVIRKRLPEEVHEQVFAFVLKIAQLKKLLKGNVVGVDATLLEANAAMKSIVRRDTGDDWKAWLKKLAAEAGLDDPSDDDLRKFDRGRKDKKVGNAEWESKTDPAARIMKMKDGRTHLAYKAEHALDLDSGLLLAARIQSGDAPDGQTIKETLIAAQTHLMQAGSEAEIRDAATDKGYHNNETLAWCAGLGLRTYFAEKQERHQRRWSDKSEEERAAFYANRRRVRGRRGRRLQRRRSEQVERSFAHVCGTGAARRSWLCGLIDVGKRYLMYAAAHNLGVLMRKLFGMGTPRGLQGEGDFAAAPFATLAIRLHTLLAGAAAHYNRFRRADSRVVAARAA